MPEKNINDLFAYYAISLKENIIESGKITTDADEGLPAQLFYINQVLTAFKKLL